MKPPRFTYHRPETRDEVDALLGELGDAAKILAGGQSLLPIMNMRLASPGHIVDINHLRVEPSEPSADGDAVVCGPLVRHDAAERSALVADRVPLLRKALAFVAHPAIRSRGTVIGSIAHADPAAELPAALVALEGDIVARSTSGTRIVAAGDFFTGPFENSLRPGEWVVEVRWPRRAAGTGYAFEEFARRRGDYGLCGVAAVVRRSSGAARASLAYLGMGPAPARLEIDYDAGSPRAPVDSSVERLDPPDDIHASASYRLHLARRLGERAVRRALEAAEAAP